MSSDQSISASEAPKVSDRLSIGGLLRDLRYPLVELLHTILVLGDRPIERLEV